MTCSHQTPRLDGVILRGCYECEPPQEVGLSITYKYGREDFHGPTIAERQREHHESNELVGRKLGRDYDTAWRR